MKSWNQSVVQYCNVSQINDKMDRNLDEILNGVRGIPLMAPVQLGDFIKNMTEKVCMHMSTIESSFV